MTAILLITAITIYLIFYFAYGRTIEKKIIKAEADKLTPAHRLFDGVDYIPANRYVLFGHHFASIAGAAPIIGPVVAMVWGWLPGLLWVWFGNIFIGAVHDYLALMASVRYDGKSIEWVAGEVITRRTRFSFSIFIFIVLILVIAAFSSIVCHVFVDEPSVPTAQLLVIMNAIIFGTLLYRVRINFKIATIIGIVMLVISISIGYFYPIKLSYHTWLILLLIYIIIAASLPVNVLLQPRDYLNSWLLLFGLIIGTVSIVVGHFSFNFPSVTSFSSPVIQIGTGKSTEAVSGPLWPVVPLIIACGSLSGFHSLVGSGTTSKQIDREIDGLFIGYGAMFTEGFLSTIVILTLSAFALHTLDTPKLLSTVIHTKPLNAVEFSNSYLTLMKESGGPIGVFSKSFGALVNASLHPPKHLVTIIAALWCSAFAMTTLDTTGRIARYTLTELCEPLKSMSQSLFKIVTFRWVASIIPAVAGILLAWTGKYSLIWPAFGGANQMLASIALITASIWVLKYLKSKGWIIVVLPALILWITVTSALVWYMYSIVPRFSKINLIQGFSIGGIVVLMILLNIALLVDFIIKLKK